MGLQSLRWRTIQAVQRRLLASGPDGRLQQAYRALRTAPPVRLAWRLLRGGSSSWLDMATYVAVGGVFANGPGTPDLSPSFDDPKFFETLLDRAERSEARYEPSAGRIVLINNGLAAGGAERQIVYTLQGLRDRGADVHFLGEYLGRAPGLDFHLDTVLAAGVEARAPRLRGGGPLKQMYAQVTRDVAACLAQAPADMGLEILAMVEELRALRPAVVHLWQDETSVKHGLSAVIAGVPRIVLSGRNLHPEHFAYHRPYMRSGYRALSQSSRIVLSNNSCAGAGSYADWLGLDRSRIAVVHNGLDVGAWRRRSAGEVAAWRAEQKLVPGEALVLGVFRLSHEKQPLLWLEIAAAARARAPRLRFRLIGDGPMRQAVDERIRERGLAESVIRLGEIRDVGAALAASDVVMLASAQEGLPNVLLEAQWHGRPCLTTDAGGAREAIREGVTGRVLATDDPRRLAEALLQMVSDESLAATARREGPRLIERDFGLARMLNATRGLYAGAAGLS